MNEYLKIPGHLREMLADIENARLQVGRQQKKQFRGDNARLLVNLATASARIAGELRQWAGKIDTEMDKMSPAQKAQVMIQFVQSLPLSARRDVYHVMAGLETERPDGLRLTLKDRFEDQHVPDIATPEE